MRTNKKTIKSRVFFIRTRFISRRQEMTKYTLHYWHDALFARVASYQNINDRKRNIRECKPDEEVALRIKAIRSVPAKEIPLGLRKLLRDRYWSRQVAQDYYKDSDALHRRLCKLGKYCPWDGKTLFGKGWKTALRRAGLEK